MLGPQPASSGLPAQGEDGAGIQAHLSGGTWHAWKVGALSFGCLPRRRAPHLELQGVLRRKGTTGGQGHLVRLELQKWHLIFAHQEKKNEALRVFPEESWLQPARNWQRSLLCPAPTSLLEGP